MASGFTWKIELDLIPKIIASMDAKAEQAVDTVSESVLTDIKSHAPVATGRMRDSYYKATTGPATRELRSGDDLDYPWWVEFGHHTRSDSWVPAQPHFAPAFDRARDTLLKIAQVVGLFEP